MANEQDLQRERELLAMAQERRDYAYDILEAARQQSKEAGSQTQEVKDYLSYSRLLVKDLSEQLDIVNKVREQTIGTAGVEKARAQALDNLNKIRNQESALLSKAKTLQQDKATMEQKYQNALKNNRTDEAAYYAKRADSLREQSNATIKLVENAKDQVENAQEALQLTEEALNLSKAADKKSSFFSGLAGIAKSIPGLKGLSGPFDQAAKAARKVALEGGSGLQAFKAGGASLLKSFGKGGILGIVIAIGKKILEINQRNVELARTMNITAAEAAKLAFNLTASAKNFNYLEQRLGAAVQRMSEFTKQFGIVATSLSQDFLQVMDQLQVKFGLSTVQANTLGKQFAVIGGEAKDVTTSMLGAAEAAETQLGINLTQQQVLQDLSEVSARTSLIYGNDVIQLTNAVVQARRLGLSIQEVSNIARGLLDFESSISAELEAELLTGRELNLERARLAALNNDYATVAAEIAKNVGSAAEFSKMNFIQQEAIAKSVGMTADELGKVLFEQEALTKLGFANAEERRKAFDKLVAEKGMRQAIAEFGDKEYARQVAQTSLQEKFMNLVANVGTIFMETISPEVEKLAAYLEQNDGAINEMIQGMKDFATGVSNVGTFINGLIVKPIQSAVNLIQSVAKGASGIGKILTGNVSGGWKDLKSAWADASVGTANALDIGTNLLVGGGVEGEANYFSNRAESYRDSMNVDDFTIRTNPKDTLVMAGGTKFGEETNALLKELIEAVKSPNSQVTQGQIAQAVAVNMGVYERGVN